MTHEEKLSFVIGKIHEALPEIKELKFGCLVKEKPAFGSKMRNDTFEGGKIFPLICKDNVDQWLYLTDGGFNRERENIIIDWHNVIGRKIGIADVLLTINQPIKKFSNHSTITVDVGNMLYLWELKNDDITKQSEETISYLYTLLAQ